MLNAPLHSVLNKWLARLVKPLLRCFDRSLLDHRDDAGNTALHYASRSGGSNTVKMLVAAGAHTHLQNAHGTFQCASVILLRCVLQNRLNDLDLAEKCKIRASDLTLRLRAAPLLAGQLPLHIAYVNDLHDIATVLTQTNKTRDSAVEDVGGFTPERIRHAKTRHEGDRMHTDNNFREQVNQFYSLRGIARNDTGGWSKERLSWAHDVPCHFEELSPVNLTQGAFEAQFVNLKRPVVIRGGAASFYARKIFRKKTLLKLFGSTKVSVADIPYKSSYTAEQTSLASIKRVVAYMPAAFANAEAIIAAKRQNANEVSMSPLYVFNQYGKDAAVTRGLKRLARVAEIPNTIPWVKLNTNYSLMADMEENGNHQFYLGGEAILHSPTCYIHF